MNKDSMLAKQMIPLRDGLRTYYFDIGINVLKWKNMPNAIPPRYPEKWLYENGLCVFFQPDGLDYMCLPVVQGSIKKNVYGEPSEWRAMALGEFAGRISGQTLDASNSVLIRNDSSYRPTKPYVDALINQMINVELTTRMNINAQKMPFFFKGTEDTILQQKNLFLEFMECEPAFFKTKFASDEFEIFQSGAPFIANDLVDVYTEYDARILTYLGINNLPIEKKERLLTDEVGINKEEKSLIRDSRLIQRQLACDEINKLFNLNVSIEVNKSLEEDINETGTMPTAQWTGSKD